MDWRGAYLSAGVALFVSDLPIVAQGASPWITVPVAVLALLALAVVFIPQMPAPGKERAVSVQITAFSSRRDEDGVRLRVEVAARRGGAFQIEAAWLDPAGEELPHASWRLRWINGDSMTTTLSNKGRDYADVARVLEAGVVVPLPAASRDDVDQKVPMAGDDGSLLAVTVSRSDLAIEPARKVFTFQPDETFTLRLVPLEELPVAPRSE